MLIINDLLDLKNRNLYLDIEGKRYPMNIQFYVADGIFFFEVNTHEDIKIKDIDALRYVLELEAEDSCWRDDLYEAPMNRIGNCEMRFPKSFNDVIHNNIFDNCYTITGMDITTDDVIIKLK